MSRTFLLVASVIFTFTLKSQVLFELEHVHQIAKNEMRSANYQSNRERDIDITYNNCYWKVDPGSSSIVGQVTTEFIPLKKDQQEIHLDLLSTMVVDSVLYKDSIISFVHDNDLLKVNFSSFLSTSEAITVFYHGAPVSNGLGTFKADTFRGSPVLWTLSQPYGSPGWWPCNSALGERIDSVDIFIDVPEEFVGVSHGTLLDTLFYLNRTVYHWKHSYSIPTYLIAFAAGDYKFFEDQVQLKEGVLPFHNYIYSEVADTLIGETEITKDLLQFYDSIFVPYPYMNEKYGHVQFTRNGGMEHTTISFMNNFNVELIAHELVHQWVGNLVTCASWQELWLNEGITTYFTGIMYESVIEGNLFPRWRRLVKRACLREPNQTIFASDTTDVLNLFSSNMRYTKPAFVMHMLRNQVGDSAFFEGFRNYLSDTALVFSFATEADLKKHMELVSNQDLDWFFQQWIHEPGHPIFSANWEQLGSEITVQWQQKSAANNGFVFRMPVDFTAFYNGQHTTVSVTLNTRSGELVIPVKGTVDSVLIDYDNQLILEVDTIIQKTNIQPLSIFPNPASEKITFQLASSTDAVESLEVLDSQGRLVFNAEQLRSNYAEIIVKNWSPGVYVGKINSSNGTHQDFKFVVQ